MLSHIKNNHVINSKSLDTKEPTTATTISLTLNKYMNFWYLF
jgi:hypothetical protein